MRTRPTALPHPLFAALGIVSVAFAAVCAHAETKPGKHSGIVTSGETGKATCLTGNQIPLERLGEIRKISDQTWAWIADRDTDELWELAGKPSSATLDQERFAADMGEIADRIGSYNRDKPEEIFSFSFEGKFAGVASCGSEDRRSPVHRALTVSSKGEDVAIAWRHSKQPPFERVGALEFRKDGRRWKMSAVHASAIVFNGKEWSDYDEAADAFGAEKPLSRLLLLEVALAFAKPAPYVSTPESYIVGDKIQQLLRDKASVERLTRWSVGGEKLSIQQVTVITTRTGLRPQIMYVTKHGLDSPEADAEAEAISEYLAKTHPELAQHFGDLLLEGIPTPLKERKRGDGSHRAIKRLKRH